MPPTIANALRSFFVESKFNEIKFNKDVAKVQHALSVLKSPSKVLWMVAGMYARRHHKKREGDLLFYTKHKLSEDSTVITTLRGDNVFTRCPCCGAELAVDLARVFSDGNGSMEVSSVLCEECSAELLHTGGSQ